MTSPTASTSSAVTRAIAKLPPAYFALVMATGIVAVGAKQQHLDSVAQVLYAVAAAAYAVLLVLVVVRLVFHTKLLVADLTAHAKGFGFLTMVAGTNVLAAASIVVHGWWRPAEVLWWASLPLFCVLAYSSLISVILQTDKPPLGAGINGSWFLLTVSVESIASTGALLVGHRPQDLKVFLCIAAFGLGMVLYLIVMTLLFLRWTFQPLEPTEADPPVWIAAGAVAITVLAGSNILAVQGVSDRIARLGPAVELLVVTAWATSTFWFPVMIAIGVWRHVVRRLPLRYQPAYWAMVFPLGMYGASTFKMLAATGVEGLDWVPKVALAVAATAWTATFIGLVAQGAHALTAGRDNPAGRVPR